MDHIQPIIFKHVNNYKFYLFIIVINVVVVIIIMCDINFFYHILCYITC
ncbi:hypothetical protein ACMBCN_03040 [Candidatus Liberibacter asiaticus]|nr:hypothetical protein [Candidatus Liberibacter asiaticus]